MFRFVCIQYPEVFLLTWSSNNQSRSRYTRVSHGSVRKYIVDRWVLWDVWGKMADAEGHAGDNIASLDLKDIEEGTVIELLRRRFSQGVIYVSELCKIHWNGDFLSWHVSSRIGNSILCKFVKFALFSDGHWRHFSFSESFQATFDIWTWGKRAWSQIFILIFVWGTCVNIETIIQIRLFGWLIVWDLLQYSLCVKQGSLVIFWRRLGSSLLLTSLISTLKRIYMLNRLRCLHSLGFIDFESISFKVNRGRYKERKECLSLFDQKSFVTFN